MSTTLPRETAHSAPQSELSRWTSYLDGEWEPLKKSLQRKRTRTRLEKAFCDAASPITPLLWTLPEAANPEAKLLLQRLDAWAHQDQASQSTAVKNGKAGKGKKDSKKQKKAKKSKTLRGKTGSPELDPKILAALRIWLDEIGARPADESSALEAIAWARLLPRLSQCLEVSLWAELFEALRHRAYDSQRMPFGQLTMARQLLAAELPVTLACVFVASEPLQAMGQEGMACVAAGMSELLDGEGLIHADHLPEFRVMLACWTRVLKMAQTTDAMQWEEDLHEQYEWMLRQCIRFTRHDGQQILNGGRSGRWHDGLMRTAFQLDQDPIDLRAASLLPWEEAPKFKTKAKYNELPLPGCYSEWARCGVLSAGWAPSFARVGFAIEPSSIRTEWNAGARTWFDGQWGFELQVDGRLLRQTSDVQEICWHEDEDVDYIELEAKFDGGWVVQRQIMLDRRHQFVFVADAALGKKPGNVVNRMTLPLAGAVKPAAPKETRELVLKSKRTSIDVLPLGLPEWRSAAGPGELTADAEQLVLEQRGANTCGLYSPLFIHLNPNRDKKLTWRQLTVAANLEIAPVNEAVGYRVQYGQFHWIFFRSLGEVAPRTILGQHLNHEFFAGRFLPDGEVEELVAIEGPEAS